jgi:putative two-component system response regulator
MQHEIDGLVKPTILVVDDTPDNLSLMMELLKGVHGQTGQWG